MVAAPPVLIRPAGAGEAARAEEKPYQPFGAARELFLSKQREVLLSGPAGTGKSRACLEKLNLVAMQRPIRAAIIRKTRKSLTQSAMTTLESKVLPQPNQVRFHEGDQEYRYPSGARVMVAGLDDPEKVGSTEFDLVYVQEATELEEDDWGMLLRGLRNGVLSYQQLIADCNPSSPDHWLKQRCNRGECLLLESKHEDNPTLWQLGEGTWTEFGKEYVAGLDSLQGYLYQRLRLGLWVAAQGMYFTEFDPQVHVCKPFEIPDEWPRWFAVDYGFAAPFCCLWFAREPETRRIFVYKELYGAGLRDEQQAEKILEACADEPSMALRVLDPSMFNIRSEQRRPSIASVYAEAGVWPVVPGMNSRKQGWAIVRRALAYDQDNPSRLQIFPTCKNLLRTLPTMVVDPLDPEDLADKVGSQKTEDHAVDALRYGLCAEAQPPRPTEPIAVTFG
jgi:PBSX family phage terminase large subunit